MLHSGEKLLIRKVVFGKIGLIALIIVCAVFAKGTWGVYKKARFAKENRDIAEQELHELSERKIALEEELARLDTKRGMEEEMRQKFDVGYEGEHLIVLVDAPESTAVTPVENVSIWHKVVTFFGFGY